MIPRRYRIGAAAVGLVCLLVAAVLGVWQPTRFFQAYLVGYTFWLGLSLGCLGLAFIQFLTGGLWGLVTRRILEAGAACLPLLAVLFLPVLLGMNNLYIWTQPQVVAADAALQHKAVYLNAPFFIARTLLYFAAWLALALTLRRWSIGEQFDARGMQRLSIIGLLVLPLTVSFAAIDWWMSLEPTWFSTMYPATICAGDLLLALAFTILVRTSINDADGLLNTQRLNDLGSLLLALLMLWAYVTYFQYMLIWAGNLREEITWFVRRTEGGWQPIAWIVAGLGFVAPFWLLLFSGLKRNQRWLRAIAVLILAVQVVENYWLVKPAFTPEGPSVNVLEPLTWVGVGALWMAVFTWSLAAAPLIPRSDPRLAQELEAAGAAA